MSMIRQELLNLENLSVDVASDRGWLRVVDGVCLNLARRRVLGIVGESGCGKTMTALAITRLLPARACRIRADRIWFNNEDLNAAGENRLRQVRGRDIAYVFQEPSTSLNPVMTIEAQLEEVTRLHRSDVPEHDARSEMRRQLEAVGIRDPEQKLRAYPHQLSGGEKQRVMIAMALLAKPQLIIADEPTTALDVTIQAQLLALLKHVTQEYGVALVIISHDLSVVAELADDIGVMYAGQMVEYAPAEQLIDAPRHPYTQGLIASLPEQASGTRLAGLSGEVPRPGNWPRGCRFHPRCPQAFERCSQEAPPVFKPRREEEVRCWLYSV